MNRLKSKHFMNSNQSASLTLNLTSAFVFTLFTFCPPGPDERAKLKSNLSIGIETQRIETGEESILEIILV